MSLTTILVHVDDGDRCDHRLKVATRLALDLGARLVGVYLVPTAYLAPSVAALLPADLVRSRERELGEAQHAAEERFRIAANSENLTRIEWRAPAGSPIAAAVDNARCADLFVVGQRAPDDPALLFADELIGTTLFSSGRPLLIVPHIGASTRPGRNVLVAWDGGREAARAVGDALPLLKRARQVHVVSYDAGQAGAGADVALSASRLRSWLQDHGIEARVDSLASFEGDVGELILSQVADRSCDLIVMGGYGHSRLREFVLGGATRTLLASMTVPVLMAH
jgi:nucleotide-binding universal stress UspA family protein